MSKITIITSLLTITFSIAYSQSVSDKLNFNNKGKLFISWGWNRAAYTRSDIHFKGDKYDFVLKDVVAKDRPSNLSLNYINPTKMTIPQYNFRIGYYFNPKYSISFGFDHMKYVMKQDQTVRISGNIDESGTGYDKSYYNDPINLTSDFLQFEHTNGLNYLNLELRRTDYLFNPDFLHFKNVDINYVEGFGLGVLYPKSDVTLLNYERNDQWHLAGYGLGVVGGLNIKFFKRFFVQGELKGGYINLPNIITSNFAADRASQHFFFTQFNVSLGFMLNTGFK